MPTIETAVARCKHGVLRYLANDQYVGRSLELYGEFSDMEAGLFDQLLKPGATVVEVGANIGALTIHLAQKVGDKGRVIAFEPQRVVHGILVENLQQNGCANTEAICAAVGDHAGIIPMPRIDYADGKLQNFGAVTLGEGTDSAPLLTLDSLRLERLDLLKIDVEGMEASVIEGARETIARCKPILYVENDRKDKSAALIALLMSMGYQLWWHLPPLYSPKNCRGNKVDVFHGVVSVNMLCLPAGKGGNIALRKITSPRDDWQDATRAIERTYREPLPGEKTAAIVRLGAFGDALWSSSIFPHLKEEGYHLTVYTEPRGEEVLRHDPHVDRIIIQDHLADYEMDIFWRGEAKRYDRFINLTEAVEKNMLAIREDLRFYWPQDVRRIVFAGNYLERVHQLAGVPWRQHSDFRQRFYASDDESQWAHAERASIDGPVVVIAAAGSSVTKSWPHIAWLADALVDLGAYVVILGDPRDLTFTSKSRVRVIGMDWDIRRALAFARLADAVVGQETGILNAVAMESMRKVVLLTHSTADNLTKHWANTVALNGTAPCWPCHQIHQSWSHCTRDEATGKALCQATIRPERVLDELRDALLPAPVEAGRSDIKARVQRITAAHAIGRQMAAQIRG